MEMDLDRERTPRPEIQPPNGQKSPTPLPNEELQLAYADWSGQNIATYPRLNEIKDDWAVKSGSRDGRSAR